MPKRRYLLVVFPIANIGGLDNDNGCNHKRYNEMKHDEMSFFPTLLCGEGFDCVLVDERKQMQENRDDFQDQWNKDVWNPRICMDIVNIT